MKTTRLLIFTIFILFVLNVNICPLFAEAPTTPKIVFTSSRSGNSEIYIMNPDGSEQVNLTQHPAIDLQAVWSPTGEQILFVSNRGDFRRWGTRDLYTDESRWIQRPTRLQEKNRSVENITDLVARWQTGRLRPMGFQRRRHKRISSRCTS